MGIRSKKIEPQPHVCNPDNLRDLARLLDEERDRHNHQMDLIKKKILLEAGLIKTPEASTHFTSFNVVKRKIEYREL